MEEEFFGDFQRGFLQKGLFSSKSVRVYILGSEDVLYLGI